MQCDMPLPPQGGESPHLQGRGRLSGDRKSGVPCGRGEGEAAHPGVRAHGPGAGVRNLFGGFSVSPVWRQAPDVAEGGQALQGLLRGGSGDAARFPTNRKCPAAVAPDPWNCRPRPVRCPR
eukprot:1176183-Prorocentrum_minimum.AAC.1